MLPVSTTAASVAATAPATTSTNQTDLMSMDQADEDKAASNNNNTNTALERLDASLARLNKSVYDMTVGLEKLQSEIHELTK